MQLTNAQLKALRRASNATGKSVAELIRQGVDHYLAGRSELAQEQRIERAIRIAGKFSSIESCHIQRDNVSMAVISVRVEKSGRILIPAAIRRRLGLKEGESNLLLNIDETPIGVTTRAQALARVRKTLAKYHKPGDDWVAELIAERQEEARIEEQGE